MSASTSGCPRKCARRSSARPRRRPVARSLRRPGRPPGPRAGAAARMSSRTKRSTASDRFRAASDWANAPSFSSLALVSAARACVVFALAACSAERACVVLKLASSRARFARALHGGHHGQPDQAGDHRRRCPGHRRPVPPHPSPRAVRERLAPGGHRLVGQPVLDVVGQLSGRAVPAARLAGHGAVADGRERRRHGGIHLAGRGYSPAWTLRSTSSSPASWNGARPVSRLYSIAPRLYTSLAGPSSSSRPAACSGLM